MTYIQDNSNLYWDGSDYPSSYPMSSSSSSGSSRRTPYGSFSSQGSGFNSSYQMSPVEPQMATFSNSQAYYSHTSAQAFVQPQEVYTEYAGSNYNYDNMSYDQSYPGQTENYPYDDSPTGATPPLQVKPKRDGGCTIPGCTSKAKLKRETDLQRHIDTVHYPKRFPCEHAKGGFCGRHRDNGFTRKDHYNDHLRDVHRINIPKAGKGDAGKTSRR